VGEEVGLASAPAVGERGVFEVDPGFAVWSRRLANGMFVVAARGEIDLYTAPELERALSGPAKKGARQLVVDLSGASFVDSTALHLLLRAARQVEEEEEGEMIVVVPDRNVRKVFEITGFDRLFSVVSSSPALSVGS